jgi:DNA-binding MarR family transcriptional regulator
MIKNKLPFGFEKPEDSPGFLLWQTTIIWQRMIKKELDVYNISHAQFVIMATLFWFQEHKYDTNQTLIINITKLDKMTVSKSIKKLVLMNLINRIEDTNDSRAKKISLTHEGKKLLNKLIPIVEKIDSKFFNKVSEKEQKDIVKIFGKLSV